MAFQTDIEKQVIKFNFKLDQISKKGIPDAAAGTLDNLAFKSKKLATKIFEAGHIIRSNFMQRGLLFQKTRKNIPIRDMESRQGSIRPAGKILEKGGTLKPTDEFLSIPTIGARVGKSKRRRVAKKFTIRQMKNARRLPNTSGSAKSKFAAMLAIARKEKYYGPFVITEKDGVGKRVGVFNLTGHGRGKRGGGKITMIRSLKKSAKIKGKPYIRPAGLRSEQNMDKIYIKQAKRVLKRYGRDIR